MKSLKIDPRMFICPPYIKCPKCGQQCFGVLGIDAHSYLRRCKRCLYPSRNEAAAVYPLPDLNKEVIYVDQFVLSNMMKILNPRTKAYKKGKLDTFWQTLFERLDSLCKLHLIVCPESGFHTNESLLSPYFEPLKQMYELLSGGVRFHSHDEIKRLQLCEHAKNWLNGKADEEISIDVRCVTHGDINAWQDHMIISIKGNYGLEWISELRNARRKTCRGLIGLSRRWKTEKGKEFDDWFQEESSGFGKIILRDYCNRISRLGRIYQDQIEATQHDIFTPYSFSVVLVKSLEFIFRQAGVKDGDIWHKTLEYLTSATFKNVPFVKISSMFFAALASAVSIKLV